MDRQNRWQIRLWSRNRSSCISPLFLCHVIIEALSSGRWHNGFSISKKFFLITSWAIFPIFSSDKGHDGVLSEYIWWQYKDTHRSFSILSSGSDIQFTLDRQTCNSMLRRTGFPVMNKNSKISCSKWCFKKAINLVSFVRYVTKIKLLYTYQR